MYETGDRLELLWPGDEEPSEWRVCRITRTRYWRSDVVQRITVTVERPVPPWGWESYPGVDMIHRSWWGWTDPFEHTTPVDRRPPTVVRRLPCPTPK